MTGSLGSYVWTRMGPLAFLLLITLLNAIFRGTLLALLIAESIKFSGYPLEANWFFSSLSLMSLLLGSVQVLIILRLRPYGIDFLVCAG